MKETVLAIFVLSAVSGMVLYVFPNTSIKRYISFAFGVYLILSLFSGLKDAVSYDIRFDIYETAEQNDMGDANKWILGESSKLIAEEISKLLGSKYNIPPEDIPVYISLSSDGDEAVITKIEIDLRYRNVISGVAEAEEYLEEMFMCEVIIYVS